MIHMNLMITSAQVEESFVNSPSQDCSHLDDPSRQTTCSIYFWFVSGRHALSISLSYHSHKMCLFSQLPVFLQSIARKCSHIFLCVLLSFLMDGFGLN